MSTRPRILVISLSPLISDARVLRQLSVVAEHGHVTSIGYGPAPDMVDEHIEIPRNMASLPQTPWGVIKLALRAHRHSELAAPAIRYGLEQLRERKFDLVVANDARVLAFAHQVANGAPVWADMHEWAPEERTHVLAWRLLVAPLMTYLCRIYLPRSAAVTTVGARIAQLYRQHFGVDAQVMRNSSPWQDLKPSPGPDDDAQRIRLVHSGAAIHGRNLEAMIDVVTDLGERYTLDLYLMPGGDDGKYLAALRSRAVGCDRIRFCDPVAPGDLPATLNGYDVGVFWIPPTHTNARLTLPNKFFDFVQARLAVAVGPSVEMADLVRHYGLGVVSEGFTVEECRRSILDLTPGAIRDAKRASDAASKELSFEHDAGVADQILEGALSSSVE
ncbi:hypothetical protein SAMN06309944_2204 [Micrococcales bacterium KH10]|nr:hypothetical protein SAMN06309944_2204 [Micrococcales bacterium KH10]